MWVLTVWRRTARWRSPVPTGGSAGSAARGSRCGSGSSGGGRSPKDHALPRGGFPLPSTALGPGYHRGRGRGPAPGSRSRISAIRAACPAHAGRGARAGPAQGGAGTTRARVGLGEIERALERGPAAAGSPSASRAIASSRKASTSQDRQPTGAEPSRTGASATVAACGSSWASRSAAAAMRISAAVAVVSPRPARTCSARSVSPSRTRACSSQARATRPGRCGERPGQPLGGPESGQRVGVTAARQLKLAADVVDPHRRRRVRLPP